MGLNNEISTQAPRADLYQDYAAALDEMLLKSRLSPGKRAASAAPLRQLLSWNANGSG